MNIDWLMLETSRRPQQSIDQCLEAIGLADDDIQIIRITICSNLFGEQLSSTLDAPQRILDFVSQALHEFSKPLFITYFPGVPGDL